MVQPVFRYKECSIAVVHPVFKDKECTIVMADPAFKDKDKECAIVLFTLYLKIKIKSVQ